MQGGAQTPLQHLTTLLGADCIVTEPTALEAVNIDQLRTYRGRALCIALPRSTADVSRLLKLCNALRIPVVPQGGNTGYCGAATPDASGTQVVLSLRRLNAIRSVDPANYSMVVEAGCILADVQRAAATAERFFPLSLGAEGSCQIGGNLSTNAGGVNVLRYGMMRELTLGLEVVLADGRVLSSLTALRKDNTGYDLRQLFIGAEGTLGVITAASLKLFPAPRASATAFVAIPDPERAVQLLSHLREASGDQVSSFELIPAVALELVTRHIPGARRPLDADSPWYVLCELTSPRVGEPLEHRLEDALAEAMERGLATDAVLAQSERDRREFWQLRENIPHSQRLEGMSLKHDVSIPIDRLPRFVARASAWLETHVAEGFLVCYGHVGDGNLHFNLNERRGVPPGTLAARREEIRRIIHNLVQDEGGSFSAEHGIGQSKLAELQHYADPVELNLMRTLKRTLDPNGILNPGKVLNVA
ncbi:MAG: FAD-binding oxidoreductase [Sinobacteraceae bacterium]|nr:FAD-binding oxidoreductase [Nevskiaceae bacterium]